MATSTSNPGTAAKPGSTPVSGVEQYTAQQVIEMFMALNLPVTDDANAIDIEATRQRARRLRDSNSTSPDTRASADRWMKHLELLKNRRQELLNIVQKYFVQLAEAVCVGRLELPIEVADRLKEIAREQCRLDTPLIQQFVDSYLKNRKPILAVPQRGALPVRWTRRQFVTTATSATVVGAGVVAALSPWKKLLPAPTLIVSQEGQGKYKTIAEAMKVATPGSRILIRPGIYTGGIIIDKPVEITGDGPQSAIIIKGTETDCLLMKTDVATVRGLTLQYSPGYSRDLCYAVNIPQGQLLLERCAITSDAFACVVIHGSTANPIIRQCRLYEGKQSGIFVYDHAQGVIEDCDIVGHSHAGIEIKQGGSPLIRKCRINNSGRSGILVHDNGKGTIEDCNIVDNAEAGIEIKQEGNPVIRRCRIRGNALEAIWVHENGAGSIEDCDLTGNIQGAWDVEKGSRVHRSGNKT